MRTVRIYSPGGYEKLKIEDQKELIPEADEVIVETKASGINYADICVRWGIYESAKQYVGWPITPGFEFAGIVLKVGENVTAQKVGDKVFGVTLFDGYAGQVKVKEKHLFPMPENYTFEQMAGFPAVYLTAYHALYQNFVTRKNMTALVHSAAGGVGGALLQLLKVKGIKCFGVVGSPHKVETAKSLGANFVVDKSAINWVQQAKLDFPDGFDIVFDANGVSTLKDSFDLLRPTGKLMVYGFHSMLPKQGGKINWLSTGLKYLKTPRFNPLELTTQNKSVMAFNLSFLFERDDLFIPAMNDLLALLEQGLIQPHGVTPYSIEEVGKAHADMESGKTTGKLVLTH